MLRFCYDHKDPSTIMEWYLSKNCIVLDVGDDVIVHSYNAIISDNIQSCLVTMPLCLLTMPLFLMTFHHVW